MKDVTIKNCQFSYKSLWSMALLLGKVNNPHTKKDKLHFGWLLLKLNYSITFESSPLLVLDTRPSQSGNLQNGTAFVHWLIL